MGRWTTSGSSWLVFRVSVLVVGAVATVSCTSTSAIDATAKQFGACRPGMDLSLVRPALASLRTYAWFEIPSLPAYGIHFDVGGAKALNGAADRAANLGALTSSVWGLDLIQAQPKAERVFVGVDLSNPFPEKQADLVAYVARPSQEIVFVGECADRRFTIPFREASRTQPRGAVEYFLHVVR